MLKLYQREECPNCAKVRRFLATHHLDYQSVNVARLSTARQELLALDGVSKPTVPVLVDGNTVIQDSDAIIDYLRERYSSGFGDPAYGITRHFSGLSFGDAVPAVKEALSSEGFGVLSEIDVKATLKKKLDVDFQDYLILGACNPRLAHEALTNEPGLGLLLPCNVVITRDAEGEVVVSAIDPGRMFEVVRNAALEPIAKAVRDKLVQALASIQDT